MRIAAAAPDRRTAIAVVALALLLAVPAMWNRFPLIFPDSGVYLGSLRAPGVPPFYALWVMATSLRLSLWLTIAVQTAFVASWLLALVRTIAPGAPSVPVALGAIVLTQLPWLASWIMPDVLCGIGILSTTALLSFRTAPKGGATILLGLGVLLAAPVASANLLLMGGVGVAIVVLRRLSGLALPQRHALAWVFASLVAAAVTTLSFNTLVHGRTALNAATASMTFSRLADTGIAQQELPRICARERFAICAHLDELGQSERGNQTWLWGGLAQLTDAERTGADDYARIDRLILARRAGDYMLEGFVDLRALVAAPTLMTGGPSLYALEPGSWFEMQLRRYYPHEVDRFEASRQQRGRLVEAFPEPFYRWSTWLGYIGLVAAGVLAWLRGRRDIAVAVAGIVLAIAAELIMHALLVGAYNRYHAKVAWIAWPCVLAWGAAQWSGRSAPELAR